jgi:hypothetical protein
MAEYDLFMGGLAGNTDNWMVPQNTPCIIEGYADHQRSRDYSVVRQLSFSPRVPWGGVDATVDQKDYCWYQKLLEDGDDIEVGDFLNLIVITPYSRLEFVEFNVVTPKTGLVMTAVRRSGICPGSPAIATVALTAASNSPLAVNALGATEGIFFSTRIDSTLLEHSFVSLEVTAVPGGGENALSNLFIIAQAEVVDWGSYDFNGNA